MHPRYIQVRFPFIIRKIAMHCAVKSGIVVQFRNK